MANNVRKITSPMPYFGGKSRASSLVWKLLGPVQNYIDPFFGSLAVPLRYPYSNVRRVVINDIYCFVVNFWRSVQADPEAVAYWADYPSTSLDVQSRREWLRQLWPDMHQIMLYDPVVVQCSNSRRMGMDGEQHHRPGRHAVSHKRCP